MYNISAHAEYYNSFLFPALGAKQGAPGKAARFIVSEQQQQQQQPARQTASLEAQCALCFAVWHISSLAGIQKGATPAINTAR